MVHPALALGAFALLAALLLLVFWPRLGLAARVARAVRSGERVLLEDALKHVYTFEAMDRACSLESLAGQLEVSTGKAASLLERLSERELVRMERGGVMLTEEGRASALQLVRSHRLWERYLADRTSVPPADWHAEAEHMEHSLSPEETERLSARLGHPRWDPHGDPIPTRAGELPPDEGHTLAAADPGAAVEVVHLEDEPREIYQALLKEGFGLGTRLRVLDRSARDIRFRVLGQERTLPVLMARNVTVRDLPEDADVERPVTTLLDLGVGESGTVSELSPACRGAQRRRLLDLGIVRGTTITAEFSSAFGDPVAYRIRGALVALRAEQASWVRLEHVERDRSDVEGAA